MSRVEDLTWELMAAATARFNNNKGLEALHVQKAQELAWW